jgi:hypothetical protein
MSLEHLEQQRDRYIVKIERLIETPTRANRRSQALGEF